MFGRVIVGYGRKRLAFAEQELEHYAKPHQKQTAQKHEPNGALGISFRKRAFGHVIIKRKSVICVKFAHAETILAFSLSRSLRRNYVVINRVKLRAPLSVKILRLGVGLCGQFYAHVRAHYFASPALTYGVNYERVGINRVLGSYHRVFYGATERFFKRHQMLFAPHAHPHYIRTLIRYHILVGKRGGVVNF